MLKMKLQKHAKLGMLLIVLLTSAAGCQMIKTRTSGTSNGFVACVSFERVSYSRNDTKETRRQIVAHNAAYEALCGDNK